MHSAASLHDDAFPEDFYIYGEGQKKNTNDLLGRDGIIDGTARLNRMGYFPENAPVWIADHPRACVDLLYTTVLQNGILGMVMLEEWFPAPKDKQAVYRLLDKMEPHLSSSEKENLTLWKKKNPQGISIDHINVKKDTETVSRYIVNYHVKETGSKRVEKDVRLHKVGK